MSENMARLGEVVEIDRTSVQPEDVREGQLYLGLENIESGGKVIRASSVKIGELQSSKFAFDERHVLFGKLRPNLAKVARPEFPGICSTDILPLLPGPRIDRDYLAHFLLNPSTVDWSVSRTSGANLPRLSPTVLQSLEIPLPPISEQRRISAILERGDDLRAQRRRALTLLAELADSIFDEMFEIPSNSAALDSLPRLKEYASQITDGEHQTPRRAASGNLLLSARNVQNGFLDLGDVDYVDDFEFERISKRCRPMRGDILMSCSGSVGRVATVATDQRFVLVRSVAMIRPNSALMPLYLEHFLRSPSIQREIARRSRSSAQANLFQGPIRDLPVVVPSLDQQRAFSRYIDAIEQVKLLHRADLTGRDQLFASLQHRAFSGEL